MPRPGSLGRGIAACADSLRVSASESQPGNASEFAGRVRVRSPGALCGCVVRVHNMAEPSINDPGMTDRNPVDRNPTTGVSIVLLIVAGVLTPMALWTSLWGGYGGTEGTSIGLWFAIIVLCAAAGGLSLLRPKPTRNNAFGPSEPVPATPVRGSAMPVVVGAVLLSIAVLEALVLVVNLPGGNLREALAIILGVLVVLGGLFLWLGIKRL
jgi:hypothetical protein